MKVNLRMLLSAVSVSAVLLAVAGVPSSAQNLSDGVVVNLPYVVTVGTADLQPGEYLLKYVDTLRMLNVYERGSGKFVMFTWCSPQDSADLEPRTEVVLLHEADKYAFERVSLAGGQSYLVRAVGPFEKNGQTLATTRVTIPANPARGN